MEEKLIKTEKINNDIAKTREKITDLQTKLRKLEQQKTERENSEILEIIRRVDVSPRELAAFVEAYRQQGVQAAIDAMEPADEPESTDPENDFPDSEE